MKPPVIVTLADGTALVDFRRFLEKKIAERWPPQRTGGRGRPSGSGMRALAREMRIHHTRLSHIMREAEKSGSLKDSDFDRISRAFGRSREEFYGDYLEWWSALASGKKE